jgi:metal-dependent amidase/aminoacylase/carboxypeptidase family protein
MQAWRHDIHRHPELAFEEHRTAEKVADLLTQFGLEVHTSVGNTGVVGLLKKGDSERALGLRADMDALKIQEQNSFEHRSLNAGKMHACGHDGHTAMLLGAAQYLAAEGEFDGTARFTPSITSRRLRSASSRCARDRSWPPRTTSKSPSTAPAATRPCLTSARMRSSSARKS